MIRVEKGARRSAYLKRGKTWRLVVFGCCIWTWERK